MFYNIATYQEAFSYRYRGMFSGAYTGIHSTTTATISMTNFPSLHSLLSTNMADNTTRKYNSPWREKRNALSYFDPLVMLPGRKEKRVLVVSTQTLFEHLFILLQRYGLGFLWHCKVTI